MFDYDPATGALRWRPKEGNSRSIRSFNNKVAGKVAGTVRQGRSGYLVVGIGRRYYGAHRLIWKLMTGRDPQHFVDHIDGDKLNNKWANLREADNGQNKQNGSLYRNNRSGVKGVCWDASHKAWRAYIGVNGVQRKLGRFKSINDAASAVAAERERLHGEFARAA